MKKKTMFMRALAVSAALAISGAGGTTFVQAEEDVLRDGEMTTLRMVFPGGTSSPASLEAVEQGLNEIIAEYMDAEIQLEILEWGVFGEQQKLMLSSGEDIALMFTMTSSLNFAASNQVMDITELCETYAADALEMLGEYTNACRVGDKLYGLPTFHEYTQAGGLVCRTDILDELGIDPKSVKNWNDVEEVLLQVKEAKPELNLLGPVEVNSGILDYYNQGIFDELANGTGVAVYASGDGTEVVNMYDTPEFMELAEKAYDWSQKGYFIPDATTLTDTRQDLLAAGSIFGYIGIIHPGTATQELKNSGVEVTTIPITEKSMYTNSVNFAQYMVPVACTTPEKAVKLLDILMTNEEAANLLMYGVEGTDYVVKDEAAGIVGYPDGVTSSTVGWNNETWLAGNGSLAKVWESEPADIWEQYNTFNESATKSPLFGFTYDTANVKNEISAISNVITKYKAVICAGYSEPKETVEKMVSELEAAGIQKVMDDAAAQIEAWRAQQ